MAESLRGIIIIEPEKSWLVVVHTDRCNEECFHRHDLVGCDSKEEADREYERIMEDKTAETYECQGVTYNVQEDEIVQVVKPEVTVDMGPGMRNI